MRKPGIGVNKYGLHEVVYGSYESRIEALRALRVIKENHNKDAWLKVQSPNTNDVTYSHTKTSSETIEQFGQSSIISSLGKNLMSDKHNDLFENSPNIIPILKSGEELNQGFYTIIGVYSEAFERDAFIENLTDLGHSNLNFFYDDKSRSYFIYTGKYDDVESAKNALSSKENTSFKEKIAIVKLEN